MGMIKELNAYDECETDEQLADLYHKILDEVQDDGKDTLRLSMVYAMIFYSTGATVNPQILF